MDHQRNSDLTYKGVNEDIIKFMTKTGPKYYLVLGFFIFGSIALYLVPWLYQIYVGQGVTGLNVPVVWGVYLVNFVFWVGVAHAGTLISAMLYITETPWRRAIARSAETMTLLALMVVAFFVFIHMGRPWNFYWTFPYPNQRKIWVSFQSPITYDVFAIGTYFTSSLVFLYFGMIPDFASLSQSTTGWRKKFYKAMSLGWRGTDRQWHLQSKASMFFASFIMPLVVSVHSIVSWDFALSIVPGYSKTVFAPYFVTGALLSGFAAVILALTLLRWTFPMLKKYILIHHYDRIGAFILVLALTWSYLTGMEIITGYFANTSDEIQHITFKILTYPYSWLFALMIFSNTVLPLVLISGKVRRNEKLMFILCIFIIIGMWLERYLIIPNSESRKFLPYMWHDYSPSWVEVSITVGALMVFISLFMIIIKIFPVISVFEIKEDVGVPMKKEGH